MGKQNASPSNIAPTLRSCIDRIESLQEQKKELSDDIREIFQEAKSNGLDVKTMREVIRIRKMDSDKRAQFEFNRDVYMRALGLSDDLT